MHVGGVAPTYGGGVVVEGGEWVEAGLIGLLVGDALGVPYEFHRPDGLPPRDRIEMDPPPGFRRAHAGVPPGTWSDDGAQALVPVSYTHLDVYKRQVFATIAGPPWPGPQM